jgi:hypothetical protein
MKIIFMTLALLVASPLAWGKAGSEIPRPKQSVTNAVALATKHFLGKKSLSEEKLKWRKECIIVAVSYDTPHARSTRWNRNNKKIKLDLDEEWSWFVKFIHPVGNDVSFTFRVMPDDTVRLDQKTI